MARADGSTSTIAPEPPPIEFLNLTLDTEASAVQDRLADLFSTAQIAECRAVYVAKHLVAQEIDRLMAILDELDDDCDLEPNLSGSDFTADPRLDDAESDAADDERALGGGAADAEESQETWADGQSDCWADCEFDPAESGLADFDGMIEQMS
jgi:hypothetical protein